MSCLGVGVVWLCVMEAAGELSEWWVCKSLVTSGSRL